MLNGRVRPGQILGRRQPSNRLRGPAGKPAIINDDREFSRKGRRGLLTDVPEDGNMEKQESGSD